MKDAIKMMESKMTKESIQKAKAIAEREALSVRLSLLREKQGKSQSNIENFSQTSVSRLERRKDMKISTLIEYLDSLGMGVEIKAYPKSRRKNAQEEILLRV